MTLAEEGFFLQGINISHDYHLNCITSVCQHQRSTHISPLNRQQRTNAEWIAVLSSGVNKEKVILSKLNLNSVIEDAFQFQLQLPYKLFY